MTVYLHHLLHECSTDMLDLLLFASFHLSSHLLTTKSLCHGLFMCPFVSHMRALLLSIQEKTTTNCAKSHTAHSPERSTPEHRASLGQRPSLPLLAAAHSTGPVAQRGSVEHPRPQLYVLVQSI